MSGQWCHCGGWWLHAEDDALHDAGMWHTVLECGVRP